MVNAEEYKVRLGQRAMDIIAMGLVLEKYKIGGRIPEACCPFHQEKTPSFKWDKKRLQWHCFGCGESLDIYRFYTEFRGMSFTEAVNEAARQTGGLIQLSMNKAPITYRKPNIATDELSPEAIAYMADRKISEQTLKDWRVRQRVWNGNPCFVFQYFDDKNELQFISYREVKKKGFKGGCETNTKPILWGMWHIDLEKPVVLTEGQPDAMAVWESGYKNVVSVPSGSNNYTWIDHCWDWLQKVKEFILFGDNDAPGEKFIAEVANRLGKIKCKVVEHPQKDANAILFHQGKETVLKLIEDTIAKTPAGIINMSRAEYKSIKDGQEEGIPTGWYELDRQIEDLRLGQISILVGRSSEGKSTVVNQIAANCINLKIPVFLYSGEMDTQRILRWLFKQVVGEEHIYLEKVQTKYWLKQELKPEALEALRLWSADLFYSFDRSIMNVRNNVDDLFQIMSLAVMRYGCKLVIIDNLMSALEDTENLNADQSNFMQRCKDFAEAHHVHVLLVLHPNKLKRAGDKLEKEDISGSNNLPNKADVIISIERQIDNDKTCDAKLRLLKDREEGRFAEIKLVFQQNTKRLLEMDNGKPKAIFYFWKKFLPKNSGTGEPEWIQESNQETPF